jgi:hypothetical protein
MTVARGTAATGIIKVLVFRGKTERGGQKNLNAPR